MGRVGNKKSAAAKIKECRFVLKALQAHAGTLMHPTKADDLAYCDDLIKLYEDELETLTGEREHQ